jgi:uncharacterized membrane protein
VTAYDRTQVVVIVAFAVFAASFIALGIWDLVLIYRGQIAGNSASRVILDTARAHPIWLALLFFVLGVLAGHFFWGQTVKP